jgi:TetR/AcrR family transcriptional regulator, lmrAB and yxaGH operons repressor
MSAGAYTSIMGMGDAPRGHYAGRHKTVDYEDRHSQGDLMVSNVRDRMVSGAARLLARRGLQATSFSSVLATTNTPRGSIYHHFPGGKDELVIAAIAATEQHALGLLEQQEGATAEQVAQSFLAAWRALLLHSDFDAGCALVAVTVAAENDALRARAADAFHAWQAKLSAALQAGGLAGDDARSAATLLLAASEGAVVICRAQRDIRPFDVITGQLMEHVRRLAANPPVQVTCE